MVRINKSAYGVFILPKYLYSVTAIIAMIQRVKCTWTVFCCCKFTMKIYHGNRQINDELFTNVSVNSSVAYEHAGNFYFHSIFAHNSQHFYWIIYLKILISIRVGKKANHRLR